MFNRAYELTKYGKEKCT